MSVSVRPVYINVSGQNYFVTGTRGFLAPHLINLLIENGNNIYALVRNSNGLESDILDVVPIENYNKIKFVYGDLTNRDSLVKIFDQYPMDGIFHCGAQSHPPTSFADPLGTFNTNIIGTANLIDVVEKTQGTSCKIMFCSTSEVMGNFGANGRKILETDPPQPNNPYGVSKLCSEYFLLERIMNGKVSGFITRSYSHTGPRRGKNFSISSDAYQLASFSKEYYSPDLISRVKAGHLFKLKVGNLETTRCVLAVQDVANAYYLLMQHPKSNGQIYSICDDVPRKMEFFTDKLIELSGLNIEKVVSPELYRPIDIQFQYASTEKLRALTDWSPRIPIKQTLQDLLNYWIKKLS